MKKIHVIIVLAFTIALLIGTGVSQQARQTTLQQQYDTALKQIGELTLVNQALRTELNRHKQYVGQVIQGLRKVKTLADVDSLMAVYQMGERE